MTKKTMIKTERVLKNGKLLTRYEMVNTMEESKIVKDGIKYA